MNWSADGSNHSYSFTYDGANRMLDAIHGTGAYTEKVSSYDRNGNIMGLQRYGNGLIDNLTYTYNGNQLTQVEDATGNSAGFSNGASIENEYTYDYNGNLTKDSNKGICNIAWNSLNLPNVVTFADGSTVTYTYAADGTKLRTVHNINGTTTQKDYCGSVIYENGAAKLWQTEAGYISMNDSKYHYYLQDHQGNNRVVVNETGATEEVNHYYAFGGLFSSDESVQPFKYNGKELDTKKGLNWYDYGARQYDATLGRWFAVDPLAEKYYETSTYSYCVNSPIRYIDIDGCKIIIGTPLQRFLGKLGLNSYVEKVSKQLEQNKMDSEHIKSVYNQLEESEHVYKILPLSESPYGTKYGNHVIPDSNIERGKSQGATMYYNPDSFETVNGNKREPRIGLAHEMGHLEDFLKGRVIPINKQEKNNGNIIELYKVELNEQNSLSLENIIRNILNYETRDSYCIKIEFE
jgi:RHS repeat-associated protein